MAKQGWSKSLTGFARQVGQDISARQEEMVLFALQQLILHSPVDTGAYKGSHLVTVNGSDNSAVPEPDKSGARVRRDAEAVLSAARGKPFKAVVLQSNIIYGESLEYGHSQQAPLGVYSIAFESLRARYTN
ncbi:hypothetical protein KUW18_10160 [Halomonas sp. DP5Y7-2]|uniref:hypothetical protein n=1 Tax=Halomonas sp. DP5Y7-2 TaxID=2859076 RepID=UPI001C996925|nr:hypothetical protein [Halomonas sp. DP5Y7-2]MBY5984453.1 hypothetical protein [Halomonas sp. DP5Y7-2]